ncbi:hypothetical protein J1614_000364 [Plenodomus biglobosus]|nr:hypothetical protein J1614_000364 [Plenodomus biglobosus]
MSIDEAMAHIAQLSMATAERPNPPYLPSSETIDDVTWVQVILCLKDTASIVLGPFCDSPKDRQLFENHLFHHCPGDSFLENALGWWIHREGLQWANGTQATIRDKRDNKIFQINVAVERNPDLAEFLRRLPAEEQLQMEQQQRDNLPLELPKGTDIFTVRTVFFDNDTVTAPMMEQLRHKHEVQHYIHAFGRCYYVGQEQQTFYRCEDAEAYAMRRLQPSSLPAAEGGGMVSCSGLQSQCGVMFGALVRESGRVYCLVLVVKVRVSGRMRAEVYDL